VRRERAAAAVDSLPQGSSPHLAAWSDPCRCQSLLCKLSGDDFNTWLKAGTSTRHLQGNGCSEVFFAGGNHEIPVTEETVGCATKEAPLPNPLPARPSRGEGEDSGASDWYFEL